MSFVNIHPFLSFRPATNTFQKKLGQEQFRASNEVNWLNNDVFWNSWCQQVIVIMIWYKSSIQERSSPLGAKMGRGSPVCQQIREKIIEMFKNNVPQRKIGRDLDISPSTVHNIIKRFKESGGISVRKGQGRKPKLNNRDLRSLRRHCIKNRHSSISDITTWAQDYFGKPLSSTTIRSYIHKCQLKLYCAKRKPYVNSVQKRRRLLWARRHLGWTITQWKRVLWSDQYFRYFLGGMDAVCSGPKKKRIIQTVTSNKSKSQGLSWYGVVSVPLAKVTCTSVMAPLMLKSWPDKTWNILCSYCLQWNTSQSKFRNHYFLFLFAFSILSQLFLIWGCTFPVISYLPWRKCARAPQDFPVIC